MEPEIVAVLSVALVSLSLSTWLALLGAALLARAKRTRTAHAPCTTFVSVLKPLAGEDDDLAANLASFARLSHPHHELLFGVASLADPAARVAHAFLAAHPHVDARLVVTDRRAAENPKVAQLVGLAAVARGEVLVISDSNVRVAPDYLETLLGALASGARIGLATSLFVGTGERTLGAALENVQVTSFIAPAVAASSLSPFGLTIGKSMAIRVEALDAIGGLASVGHVLAEDHLLGRLVRAAGFGVALAPTPVENRNVRCDVLRTVERHTRWAKMRRAIAPGPFWLEPLADPLVVAAGSALAFHDRFGLALLGAVAIAKTLAAWVVTWALRGHPLALRYLPIELLRSGVAFLCWVRAAASRTVSWRGHPFVLGPDSTLLPAPRSRAFAGPINTVVASPIK